MIRMESHQAPTVPPPMEATRWSERSANLSMGRVEASAIMTMTNIGSV